MQITITRFAKGDLVPDYMIDLIPEKPGARPRIEFTAATEVIEMADKFVAVAITPSNDALIRVTGADDGSLHRIFAPTKRFVIVDRWTIIRGEHDDAPNLELQGHPRAFSP